MDQENNLSPVVHHTKSLSALVYFIITVRLVATAILMFFHYYNSVDCPEGYEQAHWLVPLGIAALVVFMPLISIFFFALSPAKRAKRI